MVTFSGTNLVPDIFRAQTLGKRWAGKRRKGFSKKLLLRFQAASVLPSTDCFLPKDHSFSLSTLLPSLPKYFLIFLKSPKQFGT